MEFEWDEEKNEQNIAKHGVSFEDAIGIFENFTVDFLDDRFEYDEDRTISIGMLRDVAILVVVHTDRDGITRIMSARSAVMAERKLYDKEIQQAFDS